MMEQLDITGRTGEMARAFGIDFFSVLTRGSQYRVEAMMARLAHTQNYLLPAPSTEQVLVWPRITIFQCPICLSPYSLNSYRAGQRSSSCWPGKIQEI